MIMGALTGCAASTVRSSVALSVCDVTSVKVMTRLYEPAEPVAGVPESTPFAASVIPAGNAEVVLHAKGAVPLLAVNVAVYAILSTALLSDAVVMLGGCGNVAMPLTAKVNV